MPFRDSQKFFDDAIWSVLEQTHSAIELLLCDDGSRDASTAIALRWARSYPQKIRYLSHPGHAHFGSSSARNLGISAARGEIIAFLDADDVWESNHLRHEVALLTRHPEASVVCGQAENWYSWNQPQASDSRHPLPWPSGTVIAPPQMLIALLYRGEFRTPTCNLMVRKDALDAVGGFEEQFRDQYEDQVLLVKLHLSATCVISGTRTAHYRRHPDSSSALAIERGLWRSHEAFLRWLIALPQIRDSLEYEEVRLLASEALAPYNDRLSRARIGLRQFARSAVPGRLRPGLAKIRLRTKAAGSTCVQSLVCSLPGRVRVRFFDPVDHWIDRFLRENGYAIQGQVLEADGDRRYVTDGRGRVSFVEQLTHRLGGLNVALDELVAASPPEGVYDCEILLEAFESLDDLSRGVAKLHRLLKPAGTLLAAFSNVDAAADEPAASPRYIAATPQLVVQSFEDVFGTENVEVSSYGRLSTRIRGDRWATGRGPEGQRKNLAFPMVVTVRACKRAC
jgi:glycosyltransferase involved in cell wall biosynthesis